jgi:hypothetical protein
MRDFTGSWAVCLEVIPVYIPDCSVKLHVYLVNVVLRSALKPLGAVLAK